MVSLTRVSQLISRLPTTCPPAFVHQSTTLPSSSHLRPACASPLYARNATMRRRHASRMAKSLQDPSKPPRMYARNGEGPKVHVPPEPLNKSAVVPPTKTRREKHESGATRDSQTDEIHKVESEGARNQRNTSLQPRDEPKERAGGPYVPPWGDFSDQPLDLDHDSIWQLSNGQELKAEEACHLLDAYCREHGYPYAKVTYHPFYPRNPKERIGTLASYNEARCFINDQQLGRGIANTKQSAGWAARIDAAQYLDATDPKLWHKLKHAKREEAKRRTAEWFKDKALGLARIESLHDPLVSEMMDSLTDNIRSSTLFSRAPSKHALATQTTKRGYVPRRPSELTMSARSAQLQRKLTAYEESSDPKVVRMRETRQALPITLHKEVILKAIEDNEVVVINAATGSGKSTQIPQFILNDYIERGQGAKCQVVVTQPRRIAASSLAVRVANERDTKLRDEVGYQIRFDHRLPECELGSISYYTLGSLLRKIQVDGASSHTRGWVDSVSHIIIDEAHERDVDTDLLLVAIKRLKHHRNLTGRPSPKLIIMSATVNNSSFQNYFEPINNKKLPPLVELPGRTHPIQRQYIEEYIADLRAMDPDILSQKGVHSYLSSEQEIKDGEGPVHAPAALTALAIAYAYKKVDSGHILAFLPGLDDMRQTAEALESARRKHGLPSAQISLLHSTSSREEQTRIFDPPAEGVRKIILATNIAETSLTIPGTSIVVDSGKAKISSFDHRRKVEALETQWTGQINLKQRAGRAGRERPGHYFALYSQNRLATLPPELDVEMVRSDLQEVCMRIKALNMGNVKSLLHECMQPPSMHRVHTALDSLSEIGAMDQHQNMLPLGTLMLHFPTSARIVKMLLFGAIFSCLDTALTLAAAMPDQDPFSNLDDKDRMRAIKEKFRQPKTNSDALMVVNLYNEWTAAVRENIGNEFLSANAVNANVMWRIHQTRVDLFDTLQRNGILSALSERSIRPSYHLRFSIPYEFITNEDNTALKNALVAVGSAPNFACSQGGNVCRTATEQMSFVPKMSLCHGARFKNKESGVEPRIYAFHEIAAMQGSKATSIRGVSYINPLTIMLLGASRLEYRGSATLPSDGLVADDWMRFVPTPSSDPDVLPKILALREALNACLLRTWEGLEAVLYHRNRRDVYRQDRRTALPGGFDAPSVESHNETLREDGDAKPGARLSPIELQELRRLARSLNDILNVQFATEPVRASPPLAKSESSSDEASEEEGQQLEDEVEEEAADSESVQENEEVAVGR